MQAAQKFLGLNNEKKKTLPSFSEVFFVSMGFVFTSYRTALFDAECDFAI